MTQGAILVALAVRSGELPGLVAGEEVMAASAATAAATMNNEQKRRRNCGDVNARFEVIELFLLLGLHGGVRHLPDAALTEKWLVCPLLPEPNLILQSEFRA
jgi:hypothetical protein